MDDGYRSAPIPGLGPFIAAGPVMVALAGRPEVPQREAHRSLLWHTENSDERERAKEILVKGGAEDISYTEESSVRRTKNPSIFKVFKPDESLFHF